MTLLQNARPRVLNKKRDFIHSRALYIGRGSKWGNPFIIGRDGDRAAVITKHQKWLENRPELLATIGELRGRDLACFCAPCGCHGHTYLWLANPQLRDMARWPKHLRPVIERLGELTALTDRFSA